MIFLEHKHAISSAATVVLSSVKVTLLGESVDVKTQFGPNAVRVQTLYHRRPDGLM